MYNFNNLSDHEFEILCKDIMQEKLHKDLYIFPKGRDEGIDITENSFFHTVIIQVKHYANSTYSDLRRSLKDEVEKVHKLKPKRYYICCSMELKRSRKIELYKLFSNYMESADDIIAGQDINEFLERAENSAIVRKHYKLWLESMNVLNELLNQNVFVDCESLLYNIEEEQKEFVATKCYEECIDILNRERMLLLLGMPGTGKTMTTKMLALYYASKKYRVRYTTNGDLNDLKSALSADKNQKEIVLLDDCLGQHYFKMKETQQNELLGLIKYISMNPNKKLIMNSRVTIFQEAKERSIELKQFAEDEKFRIKILDMGKISIADKGRIFHNHIYFKGLPKEYYQEICRDKNYCKIVKHKNYTPRIMEFVTRKVNYKEILPDGYYAYVMKCLDNPTEIWKDEFTKKLQQEDRIFLTTLYSMTETTIEEGRLQRAFNYRLKNTTNIDMTNNVWEDVLRRLEGAFIIIVEKFGKKEIGVINPSINDFLKEYLDENEPERENVKTYATESEQILRGFSIDARKLLDTGEIQEFNFCDEVQEIYITVHYLCKYEIFAERYVETVKRFFEFVPGADAWGLMNRCHLFVQLLTEKFSIFYGTREYMDEDTIKAILSKFDLYDYEKTVKAMALLQDDYIYRKYGNIFMEFLKDEIEHFVDNVDAFDYYDSKVDDMIERKRFYDGEEWYIDDRTEVIDAVWEYLDEVVKNEIYARVIGLPDEMIEEVKKILDTLQISEYEVSDLVDYMEQSDEESTYNGNKDNENDEKILDCIFR